jgi:hypothetical protein
VKVFVFLPLYDALRPIRMGKNGITPCEEEISPVSSSACEEISPVGHIRGAKLGVRAQLAHEEAAPAVAVAAAARRADRNAKCMARFGMIVHSFDLST